MSDDSEGDGPVDPETEPTLDGQPIYNSKEPDSEDTEVHISGDADDSE